MSPEVQAEYDKILAAVAVRNGVLMSPPGDRYYGYIGDEWEHFATCNARSWGTAKETTFSQFEDTFATSTRYRMAIDVANVTCNCGQIKDREVRWEPSDGLGEVTSKVFAELYRQLKAEADDARDVG